MGHDSHDAHSGEKEPLCFFKSPLHEHAHAPVTSYDSRSGSHIELTKPEDPHTANHLPFDRMDNMTDAPSFHRHAEATTSELFYDLFFVANLTTFTSILEINDHKTLTAYVGFFSLLWLTWYQVSLYDVRFASDSVFERVAKAIHFGTMVGFAVVGPQWHPGQAIDDFKIYRFFGFALMISRFTLAMQYGVTLFFTKKYTKTILPLSLVIGSTVFAAVFYGATTAAFPKRKLDANGFLELQTSHMYIAWYVIAICETIMTVAVSCIWRVISFKGTHMVQRMSLLTLIILGEGIIVVCKAISKIVKNEFLWTSSVIGQIISAILVIYFLYMLYFDRLHEDHFGSIRQQIWSFGHFPLHIVLVLVLQGVSLLIIWNQALQGLNSLYGSLSFVESQNYSSGADFAFAMNVSVYENVFGFIPKGIDATKELKDVNEALKDLTESFDFLVRDESNLTALEQYTDGVNELMAAATQTLFDSLSVSPPVHKKAALAAAAGNTSKKIDFQGFFDLYVKVFSLVFTYVFVSAGLSLIVIGMLDYLSLTRSQRLSAQYVRIGINIVCGIGLALLSVMKFNQKIKDDYLGSSWMIPTIMLVYFVCVIANHLGLPKLRRTGKNMY